MITVDQALEGLNIEEELDDEKLAEIQQFIDAATIVVEDVIGPAGSVQTFTEQHPGGATQIGLYQKYPVSFTSVVEYNAGSPTTLTLAATPNAAGDFTLDPESSVITRLPRGTRFADEVWVTYTAGLVSPPENVIRAMTELVARSYGESQQGGLPAFQGDSSEGDEPLVSTPAGYLIPERVMQWLTPNLKEMGGFA